MRVLGQKSITGMDCVNVADFSGTHNTVDLKIAVRAGRRADANRFVCELHV